MTVRPQLMILTQLVVCLLWTQAAMAEKVTVLADCEKSPFSGNWVSTDRKVAFLSKLEISEVCKQITMKPVADSSPWAGSLGGGQKYIYREVTVRPSSSCSPADCVWGRKKGVIDKDGVMNVGFRLFLSRRYLELRRENHTLRVLWRIEYTSGKRLKKLGETVLVRVQ